MPHKLWGESGLMRRSPAADKNEILERSGGEFGSYLGDKPEEFALFRPPRPTLFGKNVGKFGKNIHFATENPFYLFSMTLTSGADPFDFSSDETFLFLTSPIFIKF